MFKQEDFAALVKKSAESAGNSLLRLFMMVTKDFKECYEGINSLFSPPLIIVIRRFLPSRNPCAVQTWQDYVMVMMLFE